MLKETETEEAIVFFVTILSVTFMSNGRAPMRSIGSVEFKYPFNLSLVATLELTLHIIGSILIGEAGPLGPPWLRLWP